MADLDERSVGIGIAKIDLRTFEEVGKGIVQIRRNLLRIRERYLRRPTLESLVDRESMFTGHEPEEADKCRD